MLDDLLPSDSDSEDMPDEEEPEEMLGREDE
jgi:hypothetical protein